MNKKEILSIFYKKITRDFKSGCECVFIKLNNEFGLKLYDSIYDRNHAFNRQRKAYIVGLAPKAFNKISIPGFYIEPDECDFATLAPDNHSKVYGYITHLAKPIPDSQVCTDKLQEKMNKLSKELSEYGLYMTDMHGKNIGYYNKKLVAIDFGPVSMD